MIEKAINENQMALIEARDVVDGLRSQLNDFHGAFSSIVAGLGKIGFPERVFEADQGCLSILIPRFGIKDDLANFAAEMKLFDRDVGFISELETGSQPVRKLIELSTSSPWVLIGVPGATVLVFLQIVVAIQDIRLKIYSGGRHELLHETNREEVVTDLIQWLDEVVGAPVDTDDKIVLPAIEN